MSIPQRLIAFSHKKTGDTYAVISFNGRLEASGEAAILYRKVNADTGELEGAVWCRSREEFLDGRFEIEGYRYFDGDAAVDMEG